MSEEYGGASGRFFGQAIGDVLPKLLTPLVGKEGKLESRLQLFWPEIAGEFWAEHSTPEKLGRGKVPVLYIAVDPAFALQFQHETSLLLERIRNYLGYVAVGSIQIRQDAEFRALPEMRLVKPTRRAREAAKLTVKKADPGAEVQDVSLDMALTELAAALASRKDSGYSR